MPHPRHGLLLLAIAGALSHAAFSAAAEPRIDRLAPQGVRRGSEATVRVYGRRVGKEPQELLFHSPGIEVTSLERKDDNALVAKLKLDGDCRPGRHAVRVRTATGVSNLVTLHVGDLPSVAEKEPNNTRGAGQAVPFNRTIHGVVLPEDEDVFAIDVTVGQRVSVEVEGLRLGRVQFDPCVEVLDAAGRVLAKNDDQTAAYSDAFLTLAAPADGKLFVRLRESAYRGNSRASYLLHVGDFPRPTAVYPPVAVRGQESEVHWIGAGGLTQAVRVPEGDGNTFDVFAADERGVAPSSLPLWVADAPPAVEAEPNDQRDQATPMPSPGVAAGVIGSPGDIDYYGFSAKKGQQFELRVRARELRSPVDAILRVFRSGGKWVASNDDDRGRLDPYVRFKAPTDGDYVLQVEERLGRGGESYTYVIDASPVARVAELRIEERRRYEATAIEVPRGGRTCVLMKATRRNAPGPLEVVFGQLPEGVTAETFPLTGGFNLMPVVFSATDEAPLAATLSGVRADFKDGSADAGGPGTGFTQQNWLVRGRNNVDFWSHWTDRVAVAVTKPLPFAVSLVPPKAPLPTNGSMELKVVATRSDGFDQPIRVRLLHHPPGVSSNQSRSIAKGASEATIPVTTNWNARTQEWPMVVVAEAFVDGRVYASTEFFTLRVVDPYFDVGVPVVSARQGESATCRLKLTPRTKFAGEATIELLNLPPGVTAAPVTVGHGVESITVELKVAADARAGRHRGVHALVKLTADGEPVTYRQAWSDMQIDPAPAKQRVAKQRVAKQRTAKRAEELNR